MTDLLFRLESAESGSRELDAEIAVELGWAEVTFSCSNINGSTETGRLWKAPNEDTDSWDCRVSEYRNLVAVNMWPCLDYPPAFTTSLDAAMTLYDKRPAVISTNPLEACVEALKARQHDDA